MARRGESVECACGQVLELENDRVPYHRKPGPGKNGKAPQECDRSGVYADSWDAVQVVEVQGIPLVLRCDKCNSTQVGNAPEGSKMDLACHACGREGGLINFVSKSYAKYKAVQAQPEPQRQHRYGRSV